MRFNQTCIAWVETTACSARITLDWKIKCLTFAAITAVVGFFIGLAIIRRFRLLDEHNRLFKILAAQLTIWVPFQFFYLIVHGFSPNNFKVPTPLITFIHMQSSMILGNIIPQLIITWSEHYKTHVSVSLVSKHYQRYYWIAMITFTIITGVISALAGVNVIFYRASMRALFGVWIAYLVACIVLLFIFGIQNYRLMKESLKASSMGNDTISTAMHQIVVVLAVLCGAIFLPVNAFFLYYAIDIEDIESSKSISLILWCVLNGCSTIYAAFWGVYIWISTTTLWNRLQVERGNSGTGSSGTISSSRTTSTADLNYPSTNDNQPNSPKR